MITPAISVLGAVEGLNVATPLFEPYVVPITVVILIGVFAIQRHGTAPGRPAVRAGHGGLVRAHRGARRARGMVTAAGGARRARPAPRRRASSPSTAGTAFAVLGAVFLVVTGGEALYADMGHFGKRPIRLAWFALVLPALLLNYFGQGALLLHDPERGRATRSSCWRPAGRCCPLVALATAAAIIASQALISGAFSLTRQAIQLGYCPRLDIEHTSSRRDRPGLRAAGELGADGQHHGHRASASDPRARWPPPTASPSR